MQQLLQSVAGGIESNKMIEMMLTLLILLSLLEQLRSGASESGPPGKSTSQLSGVSWYAVSYSATTVSTQWASISIDQLQSAQSSACDTASAQNPIFDIVA